MNFVRFSIKNNTDEYKGILEGDTVRQIYGSYLQAYSVTENTFPAAQIDYLPPVLPMTIVCLDKNDSYIKAPSSLSGAASPVKIPDTADHIICMPRICWVVKDRNHSKATGASLFGFTHMLDFSLGANNAFASSDGFTVLGKSVNTDFSAAQVPSERFKELAASISFRPGDLIAVAAAPTQVLKRGDTASFADLQAYIK